jgi:capsular polysaccharide biosynthesis protein
LFFPDSEFEVRWKARVSYADTFRELFERSARLFPVRPTPRQIYLTRRHLNVENERNPRRIVNNEADLESLFAESGFTIVAPEKLPLHEQIAIVGGADQIAGLKGSALHMSLFCQRPKARIIQLVREQAINQSLIDGLKNMENHQIFYEFTAAETGSLVDLEVIRAAMREM